LRYRYGQKRERIDENQLFLFAAQIIAASQRASATTSSEEPAAADSSSSADRKEKKEKQERRGHGRNPLPESLERRRVVFDLEESQRQCPHCQTPMQKIGEDISERLEYVPASFSNGATEAVPALLTSMVMLGSSRSVASTLASSVLLLRSVRSTLMDLPVSIVRRVERDFSRASVRATRMRS
jgi:hypothetical protein